MSNTKFEYHTLGIESVTQIGLIRQALPVEIAAKLSKAWDEGEINASMKLLSLGETRKCTYWCICGTMENGETGFSVRIYPKPRKQLTPGEMRRLERDQLNSDLLGNPRLLVMPHGPDKEVREAMLENVKGNKRWSHKLK